MATCQEVTNEQLVRIKEHLKTVNGRDEILFACTAPDEAIEDLNRTLPPKGYLKNPCAVIFFPVTLCLHQCNRLLWRKKLPQTVFVVTPTHIFHFIVAEDKFRILAEVPLECVIKVDVSDTTGVCCPLIYTTLIIHSHTLEVSHGLMDATRTVSYRCHFMTPGAPREMCQQINMAKNTTGVGRAAVVAPPPYEQAFDVEKKRVFVALEGSDEFRVFHIVGQDWDGFVQQVTEAFGKQPTAFKLAGVGAAIFNANDLTADDKLTVQ